MGVVILNNVGERIKTARKNKKLTQAKLGVKCDMADSAIRRYESGRGNPTLETLQRIADALETSLGELIGTEPQIDREYEDMLEVLDKAGLVVEQSGWSEGPDSDGDVFYIWHKDTDSPEEDRVTMTYRDIIRVIDSVLQSAELNKMDYIRRRLDLELF